MRNSDFDSIDNLFCRLVEKKDEVGDRSLTEEERVVLLVWHASGVIENGGFQYFYEQKLDAEAVAVAYDKIGCQKCAELLRLSLSLFPAAILNSSWNERIEFVEANSETFDSLCSAFWEADKGMQQRLMEYIKNHREKIGKGADR
jgi:hypothetical protein